MSDCTVCGRMVSSSFSFALLLVCWNCQLEYSSRIQSKYLCPICFCHATLLSFKTLVRIDKGNNFTESQTEYLGILSLTSDAETQTSKQIQTLYGYIHPTR